MPDRSVIPIDEAAKGLAEAAVIALYDEEGNTDVDNIVQVAVSAYLSAIGAEVEHWGLLVENGKRSPLQQRIVSAWKPLTDTKEER